MRRACVVAVLLLTTTVAWAARPTPTQTITSANAKLRELVGSKRADAAKEITTQLRDLFDIADLAQRALVDHWGAMSPQQRDRLVKTLRDIVERNYLSQLKDNLEYQIETTGEEPQGDDVIVHTTIHAKRKNRPVEIPVDYVLHAEGDHWRAVDVITDGVGLVENYRSQFDKIIKKEGVDGLIGRMQHKLDQGAQ